MGVVRGSVIVIAAMLHLTRPSYLRDLFVRSRWSLANTMIVIGGELTLGVLHGIALGVVLSLLLLIYQTSHPRGSELGQLPESEAYRNVSVARKITIDLESKEHRC